jgi:hypothetical protein
LEEPIHYREHCHPTHLSVPILSRHPGPEYHRGLGPLRHTVTPAATIPCRQHINHQLCRAHSRCLVPGCGTWV